MPDVIGFDHLVLRVADVERSLAWYGDRLGLAPVRVEEWRSGEAPFPSVRVDATTIIDLIGGLDPSTPDNGPRSRLDHICMVVTPASLAELTGDGWHVVDGPDRRFGAQGVATSVYVTDPDGNVVELRAYD